MYRFIPTLAANSEKISWIRTRVLLFKSHSCTTCPLFFTALHFLAWSEQF